MLKKKVFWIVLVVITALGAGGYAFYNYKVLPSQVEATDVPVQTARVTQGELILSASGIGEVIPAKEISVGFSSSGLIEALYVEVGDSIVEGDLLAKQGNLDQLELAVANDELAFANAQAALQDLYDSEGLDYATLQVSFYDAQVALDDALEAREVMDYPRCSQDVIDDYYYAYMNAVEQVTNLVSRGADSTRIENAESTRDTALANYNYCVAPYSENQLNEADAEIALAQAQMDETQKGLTNLQDGPDPEELAKAEANIAIAEAELAISKKNLENADLVAPFSGTVMEVTAQVGETASGSFITIADLTIPTLEIFLDEADMAMAGVGFEVEVIFDALPDDTFIGYITQVDPSLTSSGNSNVIRAVVQLDPQTFAKPQTFPVGMSASIEVIGSRAENAVLVPVEALRDLGDGTYAVFVMENGEPKMHIVEVGIMDYSYAQIINGLQQGDIVTTGIVETE